MQQRQFSPQQQQQPRNDTRNMAPRDTGRNDNRLAPQQQRQYDTQRQAIPAPRDRYIDQNRNGRDDRYDNSRNYGSRDYGSSYGYSNYGYSGYGYSGGSRIIIAPRRPMRFSSPYFSFRPQLRLSIGLTMGYPIAFPSWYDPYVVGQPGYVRPYMPYGGVSFDVEPRDAELWVDGEYVGRVSDYSSYDPPLTLVAGRHHIELTGGSYRSLAFDITVIAGQVIPYQGTLPYYR